MADKPLPAVRYLKIPEAGEPYLQGSRCRECGAVFLGEREHCARCGARGALVAEKLANHGELYSYCIVHRSFPGIDVPYVSAIVDLAGATTIS